MWFWNIVGQVEQRLLMMLSNNGKRRAKIGFKTEASTVKGKIVVHGKRHTCKNSARIGCKYVLLQKGCGVYTLSM